MFERILKIKNSVDICYCLRKHVFFTKKILVENKMMMNSTVNYRTVSHIETALTTYVSYSIVL